MAKIVYVVEHKRWGDDDDRNGWYLSRLTVTLRGGKPDLILDRKLVARFNTEDFSSDDTSNAMIVDRAAKAGEFCLMPDGWKFDDLEKLL